MKLVERRLAATMAEARLHAEDAAWRRDTARLRAWCARHRAALLVGGGAVAGVVASAIPLRTLARLGTPYAGTTTLALNLARAVLFAQPSAHAHRDSE